MLAAGVSLVLLVPGAPAAAGVTRRQPAPAQAADQTAGRGGADGSRSGAEADREGDLALEQIAQANQQALDPSTSATIDKNLGIIDQAIAENRAAVKSEPASVAARGRRCSTRSARRSSLLQDTIALINEMRKGNNGGRRADRGRVQEVVER